MAFISSLCFLLFVGISFYIAYRGFSFVYRNIKLGKPEDLTGDTSVRIRTVLLVALGQKKMFKRPVAAFLHLVIYVSFVITQVELVEIFIDGLFGTHRCIYHAWERIPVLRNFYVFTISFIEVLSLLTFFVTVAFLWRRDMLQLPRFNKPEMEGWPTMDAHLILVMELILITCIFMMNSFDMAMVNNEYGFWLSGILSKKWMGMNPEMLEIFEKIGWWGHLAGVMGFLMSAFTRRASQGVAHRLLESFAPGEPAGGQVLRGCGAGFSVHGPTRPRTRLAARRARPRWPASAPGDPGRARLRGAASAWRLRRLHASFRR